MPTTPPLVLAVVNVKGGTGKTTAAAHLAHALAEHGHRVLAVDADPQRSLYTWSSVADWTIPTVCLPSDRLYRELPGVDGGRYSAIVIDTPGTEHGAAISLAAVRAATHVIIPIAPTPAEYERLRDLRTLLDDAADRDAHPTAAVLLVRTVTGASSTETFRRAMTEDGWTVLRGAVPRLERYAQALGEPLHRAAASGYGDAAAELLGQRLTAGARP